MKLPVCKPRLAARKTAGDLFRRLLSSSKDNSCMHRNLTRIKRRHAQSAKRITRTESGNQSCARIVYGISATESIPLRVHETAGESSRKLRMVEQIRSFCGNLQFESLVERESSPQAEIHIEAAWLTHVSVRLCGSSIPVQIRRNTPIRSSHRRSGERRSIAVRQKLWPSSSREHGAGLDC